ncbi:hypothetical protein [Niastella populi]|uniref:DUF4595 domain-containing protein n=1 Tax=Niastella populi TaxID=550983 RepID=A0A1V9FMB0_9BACT|nr:hypothetical protein [Niastella populi]OQP59386.1 hypothetical protein A4R26_21455 [Niastella populi]
MTTKTTAKLLLVSLIAFAACKKDNDPPTDPQENVPQYQLKSIAWNNGLTGDFVYAGNTLQSIDYTYKNVSGRTVVSWTGKNLTELYDDRSSYKNVFEYDSEGKLIRMRNMEKTGAQTNGYRFEFHYNSANRIDTVRYLITNEAGTQPRWVSGYEYNSAGDLVKVTSKYDNTVITHTIDAYSPPVSFVPCHYIETTLMENYTIYNLGIMTQMQKAHKLPAKVTRVVQSNSDPSYVDKVEENVFTVDNYKIEKVNSTMTYPQMPGYVSRLEAVYTYF